VDAERDRSLPYGSRTLSYAPLSFDLIRFCFPLWRWDIPLYLLNVFKLVPSTKLWQLTGSHIRIWYSSRPDAALLIWRKTFSNVTITMFLDRRSVFVQRALHALCTVRNTRDGTSFFRPFSRSALMIQWNRLFFRSKNVYWDDACSVLSYVSRYLSTKIFELIITLTDNTPKLLLYTGINIFSAISTSYNRRLHSVKGIGCDVLDPSAPSEDHGFVKSLR